MIIPVRIKSGCRSVVATNSTTWGQLRRAYICIAEPKTDTIPHVSWRVKTVAHMYITCAERGCAEWINAGLASHNVRRARSCILCSSRVRGCACWVDSSICSHLLTNRPALDQSIIWITRGDLQQSNHDR